MKNSYKRHKKHNFKSYKHRKKRQNHVNIGLYSMLFCITLLAVYQFSDDYAITTDEIAGSLQIIAGISVAYLLLRYAFKLYKRYRYKKCGMYEIDRMSGLEFEGFLDDFFKKRGYHTKRTPGSGDYGVDLICEKTVSGRKEKLVIQAKRYQGKVGVAAVQEIIGGMHYYDADTGMVITNSQFTPNAYKLANKSNVVLWDRWKFKRELEKRTKKRE